MKTYTVKGEYDDRKWFVVDARDKVLGRLSSRIASVLLGKHKPIFSPHRDVGDYIIVLNAEKIKLTGMKENQKIYYKHTGYVGHLRTTTLRQMRGKNPKFIIYNAVRKMLPHNNLGRSMIKKLKVYAGPDHPHSAQKPETLLIEY